MKKQTKYKQCCVAATTTLQTLRDRDNENAAATVRSLSTRIESLEADRELAAHVVRAAQRVVDNAAPTTLERQAADLQLVAAAASALDPLVSAAIRAAASTLRSTVDAVLAFEMNGGQPMHDERFNAVIRGL